MDEQTIDLRKVWRIIQTHKFTIARITALFVILAGIYLVIVPPTYQSVAMLKVKQDKGIGSSILDALPMGNATQAKQQMNTDAEILKSRKVIQPVIEATEKQNRNGEYPDYDAYVKSHVTTTSFKDTEILQVTVTGKSPEQAQEANQMIIQGFMERLADMSQDEQKATREFIEKRVISAKEELGEAENKLQEYQLANKIYSTDDQVKGLMDKYSDIDKAKASNQLDMETAKAALSSIDGQLNSAGVSIADSPTIQQCKTQLVQLETTKAGYVGWYTDENPKMKEINQQIAVARQSLEEEIGKVVSLQAPSSSAVQQGLLVDKFKNEAAVAIAAGKARAIAEQDVKNNAMLDELPAKQKGYVQVKRDADVAQEIYVMLAKRLEEAKVAEVMVPHEIQIVDEATLELKPVKPKKALTVAIAFVLGLLFGTVFVVVKTTMNQRVRTTEDVQQYLEWPVLGMVPNVNNLQKENEQLSWFGKIRRSVWRK